MGCQASKSTPVVKSSNPSKPAHVKLPVYVVADPGESPDILTGCFTSPHLRTYRWVNICASDLGWRNVTQGANGYPLLGFGAEFQNERSGNILKGQDLVGLSINIAERAARLANRYGVTDGFQSSSNLLEDLANIHQNADHGWKIDVDKDMKTVS